MPARGLRWVDAWAIQWKDFRLDHPGLGRAWSIVWLVVLLVAAHQYLQSLGPVRPEDDTEIQSNVGTAQFLINNLASLLALIPTLLAFGAYALGRKRESVVRQETVVRYLKFRRALANVRSDGQTFFIESSLLDDLISPRTRTHKAQPSPEERARPSKKARLDEAIGVHRPRPTDYLYSAALLAAPFMVLAALSDVIFDYRGYLPPSRAALTGNRELLEQGARGIVFTGYGVYTYTLVVFIQRIHAGALSTEFLMGATLRATLMMVIGFALGITGVFSQDSGAVTSGLGVLIYFVVGAFPSWGYEALRAKAREVLKPHALGTSNLPLEYIDGLDDATLDRLDELGISNVQHLSTVDPVELMLRTQYPFYRIIDWIDQAILVTYLREKIPHARMFGIRGAIDLVGVYKESRRDRRPPPHRWWAWRCHGGHARVERHQSTQVLRELSTRSQLGAAAINNICENLVNDFHVQLLTMLWHHGGVPQSRLRARYITAIHRALLRSGAPFTTPPEDGIIPEGECQLHPSRFRKLKKHLEQELSGLGLQVEWKGSPDRLHHLRRMDDLYEVILANIAISPEPPSPPPEQVGRWRSRARRALDWRSWAPWAHA